MGAAPDVAAWWTAPAHRYTAEELDAMELATPPAPEFGLTPPGGGRRTRRPGRASGGRRGGQPNNFPQVRSDFIKAEGALGVFSTAPRGHGVYTIGGARANTDPATILPQIAITAEHYGRIARMLARNVPVTIEADIKNTYYDNPPMFNVVGEIAGTDKADEIVMLGGHFDSWHAATGATDNGAGAGAMMEAMRILKASGVKLRRTVRIGLWPGEEQGLNGSAASTSRCTSACARRLRLHRRERRRPRDAAAAAAVDVRRRCRSSRSTRSSPATSTSTTARARCAASICSRTTPPRRSSASGWSRSAAWA